MKNEALQTYYVDAVLITLKNCCNKQDATKMINLKIHLKNDLTGRYKRLFVFTKTFQKIALCTIKIIISL